MEVGDMVRCTFSCGRSQTLCMLVGKHGFDSSFWKILWDGELLLMHTDHLVAV